MADLRLTVARELLEVTSLLMRGFAARARRSDQRIEPAQAGILAKLSRGECGLSELAEHQLVRLPTVSQSVDVLVRRGLVERWTPDENRRRAMLGLTAEGRRVFSRLKRAAERHVARELAPLSATERVHVAKSLAMLARVLGGGDAVPQHQRRSVKR